MEQVLPPKAITFVDEQEVFFKFRRALRKEDQLVLDDLFAQAKHHESAAALADRSQPMETLLLSMLLEQHKQLSHLKIILEAIERGLITPRA